MYNAYGKGECSIKDLIQLYWTAFKVGALTFGGGYAMLPILQREVTENRSWNTQEQLAEYYALSQCLPGLIMVNTLAFVGRERKGIPGALAAALGAITPSLVIILLIAELLTAFAEVPLVQSAFAGIRVCVCVLILNAVLKLWKSSVTDRAGLIIFLLVVPGSLFLDVSPVVFVIGSAVAGLILSVLRTGGAEK